MVTKLVMFLFNRKTSTLRPKTYSTLRLDAFASFCFCFYFGDKKKQNPHGVSLVSYRVTTYILFFFFNAREISIFFRVFSFLTLSA